MDRRHTGPRIFAALIVLCLSVGAGPALAHPVRVHPLDVHARETRAIGHLVPPAAGVPVDRLALAGLALVAGLGLVRLARDRVRGRAIALGLALAVGVFGFEATLHAVHHLTDSEAGAACSVLAGSQHLSWDDTRTPDPIAPQIRATTAPLPPLDAAPSWQVHPSPPGRAPPA